MGRYISEKLKFTLIALIGGLISRFHGGGFVGGFNKSIKNIIWALPFGVAAYIETSNIYLAVFAFALCVAGKATGQGQYMSLGTVSKRIEPEKLDFIVSFFFGKDPRTLPNYNGEPVKVYWRCVFGLALVGFAAVSGLSLALLIDGDAVNALIIAVSGAAKALAYMIGWAIYPESEGEGHKDFNEATEIGEFLTGVFAYMGLGWLVVTSMIYTL